VAEGKRELATENNGNTEIFNRTTAWLKTVAGNMTKLYYC